VSVDANFILGGNVVRGAVTALLVTLLAVWGTAGVTVECVHLT
jgi:hypothetical protein